MIYAKPATSLLVVFRAYLASDHVTPATGKTIAITISKNGGAFGNPNAGATNATEISSGFYKVTLDTTDTGTAGPLAVRGAVATVDDVGVLYYVGQSPADVTHLLGTAHLAPGTAGTPDVNVKLISGDSAAADNAEAFFDGTGYAGTGNVIPTVTTVTTTTNLTNAPTNGDLTATMKTSVTTAATAATPVAASVTGNVGGNVVGSVSSVTAGVTLAASAVQAIWDAATSALTTAGSIGKKLADWAIHSAADVWSSVTRTLTAATNITSTGGTTVPQTGDSFARIGAPAGASVSADVAAVKVDTAAILVDTGTTLDGRIPAALVGGKMDANVGSKTVGLALTAQEKADVNAEVLDVLRTDTGTEVSSVPAAAAPIGAQLQYLYQGLRNKVDVTATAKEVHNDAGTVVGTKTLSDDGTTYSESKAV